MAFLGGLFRHHPQTAPDSLFGGMLQGAQSSPALAAAAASTGTYAPTDLPPSRAPVPYRPQPDSTASAGAPPSPPPPRAPAPPRPHPAPPARGAPPPAPGAPAMPGPDDMQRRLAYAQELGIPIQKHHFNWGHAIASFFGGAAVAQAYMAG